MSHGSHEAHKARPASCVEHVGWVAHEGFMCTGCSPRSYPYFEFRIRASLQVDQSMTSLLPQKFCWLLHPQPASCLKFHTYDSRLGCSTPTVLQEFCRLLNPQPDEQVLDVGCGLCGEQSTL